MGKNLGHAYVVISAAFLSDMRQSEDDILKTINHVRISKQMK